MPNLTKKQKLVLDFISSFIEQKGYVPSYEEIAFGLGISSPSTIYVHVENLRAKGYLSKKWNAHRSIDLPQARSSSAEQVPLLGLIAAGLPIEAIADNQTVELPPYLLGSRDTFVLKVRGDSMVDDHIMNGDLIIVEKRDTAKDGELVVALVDNETATLKRFYKKGRVIELHPANPDYQVQRYDGKRVKIQGIVIGVLRKY